MCQTETKHDIYVCLASQSVLELLTITLKMFDRNPFSQFQKKNPLIKYLQKIRRFKKANQKQRDNTHSYVIKKAPFEQHTLCVGAYVCGCAWVHSIAPLGLNGFKSP